MCIQIIERYAECRCLYYKHQVDPCSHYRTKGHNVEFREILIGYTCSKHSDQILAEGRKGPSPLTTDACNTSSTPQKSVPPSPQSNIPYAASAYPDENVMQTIRSRLLVALDLDSATVELSISIPCNIRLFMDQQFAGSNSDLGRVVTLSGLAVYGQATTCSDYVRSHWPLQGLWALSILQDAFDSKEKTIEGHNTDFQIEWLAIAIRTDIRVGVSGSRESAIGVLQLLLWVGAAFQVSSHAQPQYSQLGLLDFELLATTHPHFNAIYERVEVPADEQSCWLSLFNNPVMAKGFPVPERSNSERGLEISIELMAALGGARYAIEFGGGLVIKGYSAAFVPVMSYEDSIQWHMVINNDGTRIRYSDLNIHRVLLEQVNQTSIVAKRAILGWWEDSRSLLGTADVKYTNIDWSEAKEAGRSTWLSGGGFGFGFKSCASLQLNFVLGAKDGRLAVSNNGPLERIVELAEKTPVVLYDQHERRAWLVPTLEVILHVIHARFSLGLYSVDGTSVTIPYSEPTLKLSDQAARRAVIESKDKTLYEQPEGKAYYVRDAVLDIWLLLERMMERDEIISSTPGVKLRGTMRDRLYGWEFQALVQQKSFRRKEQVLKKSNGGWTDLLNDINAVVLFANGFEEVIKPVSHLTNLCSAWKCLPQDKDYLAVGCPLLEILYNEAGSRKTRKYLTSTHLQWSRGPTLFERCGPNSDCSCNRLQQLVYDSKTTFGRQAPPDELPVSGCVIFGQANHPMSRARGVCPERNFDERDTKRPSVEINCATSLTTEGALNSAIPTIRDDKVEERPESLCLSKTPKHLQRRTDFENHEALRG